MNRRIISLIMTFILIFSYCYVCDASEKDISAVSVAAFPGAEGGGMYSKGARGVEAPEVYHVTTLEDGGKGSLRDAVSKGGRFIVFDVGGNIKLNRKLDIYESNITILGQTAPGGGINIDNECVSIKGSNIILRYMRFRMGSKTKEEDTVTVLDGHDNIIDHCSMSWGVDECLSVYAVKNFTVQWSIISESLNNSIHTKGTHGMGGIWGGINTTAHHNLLATHNNRNPMIGTGATVHSHDNTPDTDGLVDVRNNVVYNWGNSIAYGGQNGVRVNFIGNYYRPGPATKPNKLKTIYSPHGTTGESNSLPQNGGTTGAGKGKIGWSTTLFVDKNIIEGVDDVNENNWAGVKLNSDVGVWEGSWIKCESIEDGIYVDGILKPNDEYIYDYPIITQAPEKAYGEIIKYAGASKVRDSVDVRVVNDVINKTAPTGSKSGLGLIDSPDDVGGFPVIMGGEKPIDSDNDGIPDYWEDKNGYNKFDFTDSVRIEKDGYTPLEKYCEDIIVPKGIVKADKSALTNEIYTALKIKRFGYTENSWLEFEKALREAQNTAGMVYPTKEEIDNALEILIKGKEALEVDAKYEIKSLIDKAESLIYEEYTEDSFRLMLQILGNAKKVYEDQNANISEINDIFLKLNNALNNLKINYKYRLRSKVEKVRKLNQMNFDVNGLEELLNVLETADNTLAEGDYADELYKKLFDDIENQLHNLISSKDKAERVTGDFEKMVCFNIANGTYGDYQVVLSGNNDSAYVKENIAGNISKSFILNDNSDKRTSFKQKFKEKEKGILNFKGDFCFLSEPLSETIFFRLADYDYVKNSSNNFFDVSVIQSNGNAYLRCRNYTTEEIVSTKISEIPFEKNKWYSISVTVDTVKKVCRVSFEDTLSDDINLNMENVGVDSFSIETPGSKSSVLAMDNITFTKTKKDYEINNFSVSENSLSNGKVTVKTDLINYDGDESVNFITASYENEKLVDIDFKKLNISKLSEIKNISSEIEIGENSKKREIKVFVWNESMRPYCFLSYPIK